MSPNLSIFLTTSASLSTNYRHQCSLTLLPYSTLCRSCPTSFLSLTCVTLEQRMLSRPSGGWHSFQQRTATSSTLTLAVSKEKARGKYGNTNQVQLSIQHALHYVLFPFASNRNLLATTHAFTLKIHNARMERNKRYQKQLQVTEHHGNTSRNLP